MKYFEILGKSVFIMRPPRLSDAVRRLLLSRAHCYPFWGTVPARPTTTTSNISSRSLCIGSDHHRPGRMELSSAFGSIVKVFTVAASPNWFMPWQTKQQRETTGSGFIIDGRRSSCSMRKLESTYRDLMLNITAGSSQMPTVWLTSHM